MMTFIPFMALNLWLCKCFEIFEKMMKNGMAIGQINMTLQLKGDPSLL